MEFRILGSVELWSDDHKHDLGTAKERCVLAILLYKPGRPMSADKLVDRIWGEDLPSNAHANLYTYVSRLRKRIESLDGNGTIATFRPGGYAFQGDPLTVDYHRFKMFRDQARSIAESGDNRRALRLYREAESLDRGEPLAGLTGDWADLTREKIRYELFLATRERIDVELRLSHHADLLPELAELIADNPFDEKLVEYLMLAQYRCGRQTDALKAYRDLYGRLREAHGTDPTPHLQELQQRILDGDRALLPVQDARPAGGAVPSTLPLDIRHLTGRDEEIRELTRMLRPEGAAPPTVVAIDGMAGIGKTVFTVHLAHRLASEYPDGQLFLDLHAYDEEQPMEPGAALDLLLGMIGVPSRRIPRSLADRTALWRDELTRRRILVVLDNAAGHDQIRPLLPGAPGCLTLITSRRRLVGLDDVRSHSLDVLSPSDGVRLLALAIGLDRSNETDDLADVVRLCGQLPMAIQLVGNRLRSRPSLSAADLARRLIRDTARLGEIRAGDREITVAFELSYRVLGPHAQRAFRRLGLHLGSEFTYHSAAAAIGCDLPGAHRAIDDLLDHHLVTEPMEGRFRFHNLIRDYARQRVHREDTEAERRHTIQRQLDHYVSTALLADRLLFPVRHRVGSGLAYPPSDPPPVETAEQASDWMTAEYPNLLSVADHAAAGGSPTHTALIAHGLAGWLETGGYWERAESLHERALHAWRELGDVPGQAQALLDLSHVRFRTGQYAEALDHARESLGLHHSTGDRRGEAAVLDHVGLIRWQQAHYRESLTYFRRALSIHRSIGDRYREARLLDHLAIVLEFQGRYEEAVKQRTAALEIHSERTDPEGLQMCLNNMGDLYLRLGQIATANDFYEEAAALPESGRQHNAILVNNRARIKQHTGRYDEAVAGFREALLTCRQIGDRRSEAEALIDIGVTYHLMERDRDALIHLQDARTLAREIAEVYVAAKALRRIGEVLLSSNRLQGAQESFQETIALATRIDEPYERAKAYEGLGTVLLRTRGRHHARKHWKQALRFYDRARLTSEAQAVRQLLEGPGL